MRAVLLEVRPAELAHRKAIGADRWDEMWEGVLHMTPAPGNEHQRTLDELIIYLVPLLRRRGRGTLRSGINVFDESSAEENYRIPDVTFVGLGREALFAADGIRGGGPDAVIEVRSPDDETYDKLPFYAKLAVGEVLVIDRDSKRPEVYRLAGSTYVPVSADRDGWVIAETMGLRFRRAPGRAVLEVVDMDDPRDHTEI
ncbi:MAG TPA: Uma2 family endonuclease [Thermoanaerobaculia bacterium]|jgi:Uma2 family endonuclease|nr:Uma2 family endonuclease [Thermoanaerobaculia bacterium]